MRTAIEILQEYKSSKIGPGTDDYYEDNILLAMQEYVNEILQQVVNERQNLFHCWQMGQIYVNEEAVEKFKEVYIK